MMFPISLRFFFPGFPGVFDQHRQRGQSGCPGFYIHADLHLGKRTSGRLPLCAAGYILRREETQSVCRNVIWWASSPKNMDLQSLGNLEWTWMQRHSGSHYIVFKAWAKHGVLLIWTAALEPRGLPWLLGFFAPKDSSVFVAALHLHTFTFTIYLWTMQVDKTWFSSLSSFRAVNSSSCYHCKAIVNILESRQFFVQEAFFKRTSQSLLFSYVYFSLMDDEQIAQSQLSTGRFAVQMFCSRTGDFASHWSVKQWLFSVKWYSFWCFGLSGSWMFPKKQELWLPDWI